VDRILQGTPAPISATFTSGGTPVDPTPASVSVTITRADGTVLVSHWTATRDSQGVFGYPLAPAHTALLDRLTAVWSSPNLGSLTTRHEIVGGFLCSLTDLGGVLAGKTTAQLETSRARVEERLEKALGYACVPRYALETKRPRSGVILTRTPLRAVRSMTVDGFAYTTSQISAFPASEIGIECVWSRNPVTVGYEHGQDFPDADIQEAALLLANEMYGSGATDQYVLRQEADNMAVTYSSPSSSGAFISARLNQIVRANAMPAVL
jgi:hypothetical protein